MVKLLQQLIDILSIAIGGTGTDIIDDTAAHVNLDYAILQVNQDCIFTVLKDDKGVVKAELFGYKFIEKKREKRVEKSKLEQLKEKIAGKEKVENKEQTKEAIKDAPIKETKELSKPKDLKGADEKNIKSQKGIEKSEHKGQE